MSLEKYFDKFRQQIIGLNETFVTPYGEQKMIYADWTASGRLYRPIEEKLLRRTNKPNDIKRDPQKICDVFILL